jgi:hypothetical protein
MSIVPTRSRFWGLAHTIASQITARRYNTKVGGSDLLTAAAGFVSEWNHRMSTVTTTKGDVAEARRFLSHKLNQARQRIKAVDLLTGLAVLFAGAIGYTLTLIVLDQLFVLSAPIRALLLIAFIGVTCGFLAWSVVIPAVRRINLLFAARTVEYADPSTKNSLINWLLLSRRGEQVPPGIMTAIEARAARDLARIDLGNAIHGEHLVRISYVVAIIVVLFCGYSFFTTKELAPSLQRVLFPFREIAPPTNTRFNDIQPGSVEIAAGDKVTISGYVTGRQPERVTAFVSSDNGEYWEPNPLAPPVQQNGRWQLTLADRQRSFDYYVVANDFRSPTFRVTVTSAPMITEWRVTYRYPAYTGLPMRSEPIGDIDAIEGTLVQVEATANVPVASGRLELTQGKKYTTVPMAVATDDERKLSGELTLNEDGSYQVNFSDRLSRRPQVRPVKTIRVRKDLAPTLTFLEPAEAEISRPVNGAVRVRLSASDDFGLRKLRLVFESQSDGRQILEQQRSEPNDRLGVTHALVMPIDLAPLNLKPGDVIRYWAEAWDNKLPTANQVDTKAEQRVIRITEPVDPQQRKQQLSNAQEPPPAQTNQPPQPQPDRKNEGEPPPDQPPSELTKAEKDQPGDSKDEPDQRSADDKSSRDEKALDEFRKFVNDQAKKSSESTGEPQQGESKDDRPQPSATGKEPAGKDQPAPKDAPRESGKAGDEASAAEKASKGRMPESDPSSDARASEKPSPSDAAPKGAEDKSQGQSGDGDPKDTSAKSDRHASDRDTKGSETKKSEDAGPDAESKMDKSAAEKAQAGEPGERKDDRKSTSPSAKKDSSQTDEMTPSKEKPETSSKPSEDGSSEPGAKKDGKAKTKSASQTAADETSRSDGQPTPKPAKDSAGKPQDSQRKPSPEKSADAKSESGKHKEKDAVAKSSDSSDSETPKAQVEADGKKGEEAKATKSQPAKQSGPAPADEPAEKKQAKRSTKVGEQDSSSSKSGNTEGKAGSGESSKSGQSSAESPAGKAGDQPGKAGEKGQNGQGKQKGSDSSGEGESAGEGKGEGSGRGQKPGDAQQTGEGSSEQKGQGAGEKPGGQPPGNEGSKPGMGKGQGKGEQGQGAGQGEESGQSEGAGQSEQAGKPGGSSTGGGNVSGKDAPRQATDRPLIDNTGAAADPKDRQQATNLVLKKLEDALKQKQIDPELLKRTGMTEEQFRDWGERMTRSAAEKAADPLVGKAREGFGKGSALRTRVTRSADSTAQDDERNLFQGRQTEPPREYKRWFEAYNRSLAKLRVGQPTDPSKPTDGH